MREPDWASLGERLSALTVKQLRGITSAWFAGCMGGASSKREIVQTMCAQMRHWWRLPDDLGKQCVRNVLKAIAELDGKEVA